MDTEGLSLICAGLGSLEKDDDGNTNYVREEFCSDNLKDLLRFLRRDDPSTRDVFKQVCKWEIVSKDLIPIIEFCQDDRNLVLNAVKVLVFLTMPLEPMSKDFNEQLEFLWGIKHAITYSNVVVVIVSLLEKPLENLESKVFSEDDWKLIQLVLTLFRNVLAVQDVSAHQKALGSLTLYLSLRDDFLDLLFRESVMELIIIITQHVSSCRYLRHDNLLLLEIYHHIFMGQDAESIAKVCLEESKVEIEAKPCLESLKCIMQEESEKRKLTRLHASRHSKFSGTFTRLTLDGSKTMCKGRPSTASCDKLLKPEKVHRGPSKRIVKDYARLPTTKISILERLHDFLNQFLTGGYNVLMQSIAQDIEKEHHAIQTSDVQMFFQLAQFVTCFQYHKFQLTKSNRDPKNESSASDDDDDDDSTCFKGELCGPVAATLNDSMFALVIAKWHFAFEGLKELKNNAFLSVAGSLLKTMIRMLDLVLKIMPEKSREPQTARIILYKLFYDQTDQGLTQFLLNMVRTFDAHKQPRSDLADLVEIIHVVTRLMEKLQAHGTLRVARKSRKAKKKKDDMKNKAKKADEDEAAMSHGNKPLRNEDVTVNFDKERPMLAGSNEKEESANGSMQVNEIEKPSDETPNLGGRTIMEGDHGETNQNNELLGDGESNGFLNPLGDHGESDQIHDPLGDGEFNNIPEPQGDNGEADQNCNSLGDGECNDVTDPLGDHGESTQIDDNIATGADDCDSSEDEQHTRTNEVDFQMTPLLLSLATSTIISNLCWLLKFYKSNSIATNHYIICLLRRISDDLDLAPMLYQLSCLVIFYDILNEQKACSRKEYESLVQFLTGLVRRMMRKLKDQPLLFVDLLFWKTRKECNYINLVGIKHEVGEMRKEVRKWNQSDETGTSQSKESTKKSLADALGDDEYDVVIPNQPHLEKDFDDSTGVDASGYKDSTMKTNPLEDIVQGDIKRKRRLVLNDKLEEEIRGLFEKYKDNLNCNQLIAKALDPDGNISSAQVSRKCKKLGLQLPSKKTTHMTHSSKDNDPDEEGNLQSDDCLHNAKHANGHSYLGRPMQARKRVLAMDENEEKIRSLYEHFKDHKRCSHMIANELDPDGAVTAAQVSRKLKKLGLRTSRMRSEANKKEMNEASTDGEDSDNLVLSSVRKRSKNEDSSSYKTEYSNDGVQSLESNSDDELTLGSILKKSKRVQKVAESKCADDSTNQVTVGENTSNQTTQSLDERDDRGEAMDIEVDIRRLNNPHSSSEHEADRSTDLSDRDNLQRYELSDSENDAKGYGNPVSEENDDNADNANDGHHYNDLEDSGDEESTPSASIETSIKRRKLRVVLDIDDDE